MKTIDNKKLWFCFAYTLTGLIALQIPLTHIIGSKATFNLFDAFGPVAGGFLGGIPGAISVLLMQVLNFLLHGLHNHDTVAVIRLFPMMFAAMYFGKKTKLNIIIPALAMTAFYLHPIGRSAWFYPLYWLIPIACYFLQDRSLLAKSLGATFTAHAVGSALWIYFFPLPKAVWISLIPIVAIERAVFALGIVVTYLVLNNLLNYVNGKNLFSYKFPINPNYVWKLT